MCPNNVRRPLLHRNSPRSLLQQCVPPMTWVSIVAQVTPDHVGCLPPRETVTDRQTGRHGQAHEVLLTHARAWGACNKIGKVYCLEHTMFQRCSSCHIIKVIIALMWSMVIVASLQFPRNSNLIIVIFQYAGKLFNNRFLQLLNNIWNNSIPPKSWQKAVVVPLHKKGDIKNHEN
jgi:hypothetical protein